MLRFTRICQRSQLISNRCQRSNFSTSLITKQIGKDDDIFSTAGDRLDELARKASEKTFSSFYKSYIGTAEAETQSAASFDEQKSFRSIFDYLNESSVRRTNRSIPQTGLNFLKNSSEVPLSARTQTPTGSISSVSSLLKEDESNELMDSGSSFGSTKFVEFLSVEWQKKNWAKIQTDRKIAEALDANIKYINDSISDNEQMVYYIKHKLIEPFLKFEKQSVDSLTVQPHTSEEEISISSEKLDEIKKHAEKTPDTPLMNVETLPVLIKYCFNSLTYDFDSLEETLAIFDFIKFHHSMNLYTKACDIELYNSVLKQVWTKTQNIELIKEIIDEMKTNMIDPNVITFKIVSTIYLNCMKVSDNGNAYPFLLWSNPTNVYNLKSYIQKVSQLSVPK